jgi:SPX domain protein involved in polyphosphate accumulation
VQAKENWMIKPIFNRYERKYIVTSTQKKDMIDFLKNHLVFDAYSLDSAAYTIYSIYFDTHDFSIIRNSIGKPTYKDKLRLRSYIFPIHDDDLVFLEIKKKFEGRVNKRRVFLTYKQAMDYINLGVKPVFTSYLDQQIFSEIDYFVTIHKAKPGAFISYKRIAMVSQEDDLRITFDSEILFRNQNVTLEKSGGQPILNPPDLYLMEVKSSDNFPFWLARKLSEFELYSQSFSKYGKSYQQYLQGGTSDDFILY